MSSSAYVTGCFDGEEAEIDVLFYLLFSTYNFGLYFLGAGRGCAQSDSDKFSGGRICAAVVSIYITPLQLLSKSIHAIRHRIELEMQLETSCKMHS